MIGTALINVGYYILSGVISLFPVGTGLPTEVHTGAQWLGSSLSVLDPIVPIGTLALALGYVIALELLIFGFKTFKWISSHIPFIGGKGV